MWRICQVLVMDFAATVSVEIELSLSYANPSII